MNDSIFTLYRNGKNILETSIKSRAELLKQDGDYISEKHSINTNI